MSLSKNSEIPLTDAIEKSGAVLYTSTDEKDYALTISKAKQGDADAQYEVAQLLFMLGKMKKERQAYKEAQHWYDSASKQGHVRSLYMMGYLCDKGLGGNESPLNAFSYYKLAAERGFSDAKNKLGRMYEEGRGVAANMEFALFWYKQAAADDHPKALFRLGVLYLSGEDVPKDSQKGLSFVRSAAELGHMGAAEMLRLMQKKDGHH